MNAVISYFYRPNLNKMKKLNLFTIVACLLSSLAFAQDGVSIGHWRTHLPYQKVIAVEPVGEKVYAATEYELFYYDKEDNSINILNKINGLSDIGISTMRYNESQRKLFVAYTNANVDLIDRDGNVKNMSDIKAKNNLGVKTINNVFFDGDLAYVACSFGIVVFDLKKEEVKDTYYIGNQGSNMNVTDVAIYNGKLYASTDDGVYKASLDAPNLANYAAWNFDNSLIHPHLAYTEMEVFSGKLYLNYDGGFGADTLFVLENGRWGYFDKTSTSQKFELRANGDVFFMTNRYNVNVYDQNMNLLHNIYSPGGSIEPLSATRDSNGHFWIGDSRRGLIRSTDGWTNMDVLPNGTASKNVFELQSCDNQVWVATGGHAANWSKRYMREGVACFEGMWSIYNYSTLPAIEEYTDFVCTATDPNNLSVTYVGTWGQGILKLKDGVLVDVFDPTNSPLGYWTQDPSKVLISGLAFDSHGNLWVANSGATNLLSVLESDGITWHSYNLGGSYSGIDISSLTIDDNDYKWILRRGGELLVFNDNGTLNVTSDDQTVPVNSGTNTGGLLGSANCVMVDQNGTVWIGTTGGPCLFENSSVIFRGTPYSATVKLVRRNDGTDQADPLFAGSNVLSMAVDGANHIWFGFETGATLMSFDTKIKTVHSFNTDNSPLLDNTVSSIAINKDGEVFFGTDNGIISYRGESSTPDPIVSDVVAYPNPVYPGYSGYVGIKGLVTNSVVRITTVDGAFVTEMVSEGGQAVWDCTNIHGQKVSPGVYLIYTSTKDGQQKFATKILILN